MANNGNNMMKNLRRVALASAAAIPAYFAAPAIAQAGQPAPAARTMTSSARLAPHMPNAMRVAPVQTRMQQPVQRTTGKHEAYSSAFLNSQPDIIGHEVNTGRIVGVVSNREAGTKNLIGPDGQITRPSGNVVLDRWGPEARNRIAPQNAQGVEQLFGRPLELHSQGGKLTFTPHDGAPVGAPGKSMEGWSQHSMPETGHQPQQQRPAYEVHHYSSSEGNPSARVTDRNGTTYNFTNSDSNFSAAQIKKTVASYSLDKFTGLTVGQTTAVTFDTAAGQTVTANVTKEKNGSFQVSAIGARPLNAELNGTTTRIDSRNDKGFTVDTGALASLFANDGTGVGRITNTPVGKTQAEFLTVKSNTGGEQQVTALVTNLGNGKYHITGTGADSTNQIKQLTNLAAIAGCSCVDTTHNKQPVKIEHRPGPKPIDIQTHYQFKTVEEVKVLLRSVQAASVVSGLPGIGLAGLYIDNTYINNSVTIGGRSVSEVLPPPSADQPAPPAAPGARKPSGGKPGIVNKCKSFICTCIEEAADKIIDFGNTTLVPLFKTLDGDINKNTEASGATSGALETNTAAIAAAAKQAHDDAVVTQGLLRKGNAKDETNSKLLGLIAIGVFLNLFRRRSGPTLPPPPVDPRGPGRGLPPSPMGPRVPVGGAGAPLGRPAPVQTEASGDFVGREQPQDHHIRDGVAATVAAGVVAIGMSGQPAEAAQPVIAAPAIIEPVGATDLPAAPVVNKHHAAPTDFVAEAVSAPAAIAPVKGVAAAPVAQTAAQVKISTAFQEAERELTAWKKAAEGSSYGVRTAFNNLAEAATEAFQSGDHAKATQAATWLLLRDTVVGLSNSQRNNMVALLNLIQEGDAKAVRGKATDKALRARTGDRRFEYI